MAYIENGNLIDHKPNESDVAIEFAHKVKSGFDYDIYTEVRLPSVVHRSGMMRVDAILTKRGTTEVVMAVEFKKPNKKVGDRSRQVVAYRNLNCPVTYCVGFDDIERILKTNQEGTHENTRI